MQRNVKGHTNKAFAVTALQKSMLLASIKETAPASYNTQWVVRITADYDRSSIRRCWFSLVRRFSVLRMQFTLDASDVRCWLLDFNECNAFSEVSLSSQNELDTFLQNQYDTPFAIDVRSPLWRVHLIDLFEDHYFVLTIHHATIDDRSIRLLLGEFRSVLAAKSHEDPDGDADRAPDFTDYLDWLTRQEFATKESAWRRYAKDLSDVVALPNHEFKTKNTVEDVRSSCLIDKALATRIKQFAINNELTPNILFLSAWTLILTRLCHGQTVGFGVVRAGYANSIQGAKKIVGPLLKTLPFIKTVNSKCLVIDFLKEVQSNWQSLYEFDHCPLDQLDSWSSPIGVADVFTSIYNYIRGDLYKEFNAEDFHLIKTKRSRPLQPTLAVIESDGFSVDVVGPADSKRFCTIVARALETVLKQMLSISKLDAIQLLPHTDTDFIQNAYGPEVSLEDRSLKQLLERTLKQFANHPAIDGIEPLTFAELDQLSRKVMSNFHKYSLACDRPVAILLPPGKDCLTAILASIRFGVPFFCLNPESPVNQILSLIEAAQPSLIITSKRLNEDLGKIQWPVLLINFQRTWQKELFRSGHDPESTDIAYLVHTSGSTGTPKLIQIEHGSVVNLIGAMVPIYGLKPGDRRLQMAKPGVDFFIAEVLLTLCGGATLVIPEQRNLLATQKEFFAQLNSYGITVSGFPASFFSELVQESKASNSKIWPPALRLIVVGMESVDPESVLNWEQLAPPDAELINVYGPSECTMIATTKLLRHSVSTDSSFVAIGRPIQNTCVYILDNVLQPLPDYVVGELCIAGLGVMRGYLSDKTKSGVIKNPLDERNKFARLYCTGDYGYRLPNGDIVFQGRIDNQVKLRGHRVELGAIESCINRHPDLKTSVVVFQTHHHQKQLIAYYVLKEQTPSAVKSANLRNYLKERLPDYMVPGAFVQLEEIPLTPNGKVDRKKLEQQEVVFESQQEYVAPGTETEQQLALIWSEVLKVEKIGIHDNFFDLGGHSLLAIQVKNRIQDALGVDVPLRNLFEFPNIAELAGEIDNLRTVANREEKGSTAITRVDRETLDHLPLSFAQQRLWLLDQIEEDLTAYNIPSAWKLRGFLNYEALRQTLERILERHETLRTNFSEVEGEPVQIIQPGSRFELPIDDLSAFNQEQQEAEVAKRSRLEAHKAFDLSTDRMLRARLLKLDDQTHVFLLTQHHIASDGWSIGILFRELKLSYEACCQGIDTDLPELPIQYLDYAIWQRKQLIGKKLDQLLAYWREQLDGVTVLNLPTDYPRPAIQTFPGRGHSFELSSALVKRLSSLSQSTGATLQMLLLAAFQTLLARYSSQDDIATGTPIAGRNHQSLEHLIGFFVNTLVIRTDFSGEPTFLELLKRVRESSLGAYEHGEVPFEKLVEELQPERHLNLNPLFQVLFQLMDFSDNPNLELNNLEVSRLQKNGERVRFDLEMHLFKNSNVADSITSVIVYNTDLFEHSRIERMAGHFVVLLESIVTHPEQKVSELPFLTAPERRQLLKGWNDTAADYPKNKCVHELFEAQVERTPDAPALIFGNQQLSYQALNAQANRLAHHLRTLGVASDQPVGLCLQPSFERIIGVLAILKAGGAYMPLDPTYPPARLAQLSESAEVAVILSHAAAENALSALKESKQQPTLVMLDSDASTIADYPADNPALTAVPNQLLYVLYTSGSTGKPKGVAMAHTPLVNLINWQLKNSSVGAGEGTLQFAPFGFDVFCQELFSTLGNGGTLYMVDDSMRRDPRELLDFFQEYSIARLFLPFVALQQLVETAVEHSCFPKSLREVITAGEQLHVTPAMVAFFEGLSDCKLVNQYGPVESHVVSSFVLKGSPKQWPALPPIGRPIDNIQLYVLDSVGQVVPVGVAGELYIGGDGLARGYLNRPELTAEKFIRNPFGPGRLYKTGDRVRYLTDGTIEFLERIDDQVKLRGFRIELGEIESQLNEHPAVKASVVILKKLNDQKQLVAFYVTKDEANQTVESSEMRTFLKERLPDYMAPGALVQLEEIPLTPNGKVDRQKLEQQEVVFESGQAYVAPGTETEQKLAAIWSEVLKVEPIGIHDNFFDLGGYSLLAVKLISAIEKSFDRSIPLNQLFNAPTIQSLSKILDHSDNEKQARSTLVFLRPGDGNPSGKTLYLFHGIDGHIFEMMPLVKNFDSSQKVVGIQDINHSGENKRQTSVEAMAKRYVDDILAHQPEGPYYLLGFSAGGLIAFETARQLQKKGKQIGQLFILDTITPGIPTYIRYHSQFSKRQLAKLFNRERLRHYARKGLKANLKDLYLRLRPGFLGRKQKKLPEKQMETLSDKDYYQNITFRYVPIPSEIPTTLLRSNLNHYDAYIIWKYLSKNQVYLIPIDIDHLSIPKDKAVAQNLLERLNSL